MLDRNDAARMVAHHPRLFHVVYRADEGTRESIAENGLAPGVSRHFWHGLDAPRVGHVYLATADYLTKVRGWGCRDYPVDVYAVASSVLTSARVNADEDWFRMGDGFSSPLGDTIATNHPCRLFHLPLPATYWHWRWAEFLGIHQVPSHGEWAEAVNLGQDPRQTAYSLRKGSVAYRGDIAPSALRLVLSSAGPDRTL